MIINPAELIESVKLRYKPYMDADNQKLILDYPLEYEYPNLPVWGHEYLQHWYEKVYEAQTTTATVVLSGDSITAGYEPIYLAIPDTFVDMRGYAIKKILKAGNYPMVNLSLYNEGVGGRNTSEWVGDSVYGLPPWPTNFPNGFLDVEMAHTPDLLITAWGMNDADKTHTMFTELNTQQRLDLFENHMVEGLKRIRGNVSINGRPSYNKPLSDLSIIICLPTVGGSDTTGRGNELWNQYVREIIRPLCRKYECAYADMTIRTYAYGDMSPKIWSAYSNADGTNRDGIHPNKWANAQIMSMLQELIYPVCMWNVDTTGF